MSTLKTPAEITLAVLAIGEKKAADALKPRLILAVFAGAYIGFGAALALKVTGNLNPEWGNMVKLLFGLTFPIGLLMVLTAGASLFTGDVMYMAGALAGGRASPGACLKFLLASYIGNFLGSALLALLVFGSKAMLDPGPGGSLPVAEAAVRLANAKCSLPFMTAFVRGILCNWLVCLAVFMSLGASEGVSKAALMWPPITAFVVLGMEHSVANMFFVPLGILLGGSPEAQAAGIRLTAAWGPFLSANLIPVTLGNICGGAFFVMLPYLSAARPKKDG